MFKRRVSEAPLTILMVVRIWVH